MSALRSDGDTINPGGIQRYKVSAMALPPQEL